MEDNRLQSIDYKDWFINQKRIPDKESQEYASFFAFHKELCLHGCIMEGEYINPFLYWHLNVWHTEVDYVDDWGRISDKYANPLLRDNEWIVTNEIERAHKERKGLVILGLRRFAKSVIEASYIGWGATFDENSQNVIAGLNAPDIKLITDKLDKGLNFLPEAWRWQRVEDDWKKQVTLGIKTKAGERIPFSQILIRNLDEGNNEEAIAGTKPRKLIIDEIGKGSFLRGLKAAEPGFTTPFGWACSPILTGTGGDMKKFGDAKTLMFNVQNYNFLTYNNEKDTKRVHGLYLSYKYRMEAKDPSSLGAYLNKQKGSELYNVPMLVSNEEKAKEITTHNLEVLKKGSDRIVYLKEKMYYPDKVDDIFSNEDTNIFDIEAAKRQKARLLAQERTGTPVILFADETGIKHEFTDKLPITNFPLNPSDSKDAPVIIYEFPVENPPYGLYTAGCLLLGEKVITNKGLINVEDVNFKHSLINEEGKFVNINALLRYDKVDEDVYTIKLSNTIRTTTFTKEHPILVSKHYTNPDRTIHEKNLKFNYTNISDIEIGDWVRMPNIYNDSNIFDLTDLWITDGHRIDRVIRCPLYEWDFWWFVGLWIGDGWCDNRIHKISVSFNKSEQQHIDRLKDIVSKLFNRSVATRERGNGVECTFSCQQLSIFLTKHFGKYALDKRIPEWAKRINKECKKQFILGYIDSDGCVYHEKKRNYYSIELVSINLSLLEAIQDISFSLGYIANITKLRDIGVTLFKGHTLSKTLITYHLRFGNNDSVQIAKDFNSSSLKLQKIDLNNLKKTVKRSSKGCFISQDKQFIYFKIKEINKEKYTGQVYNFDCESHTFMCYHMTTHNCDPYRQGQAKYSNSLGAVYIYKRMHDLTGEKFQDMFVASYVARPEKKETWEEQARLLIKYYNARTLCENDEISFIEYMKAKGDAHYLEAQPRWLLEIIPNTTVHREYGVHRTAVKVIDYLHGCLKKYMEEVVHIEKNEDGSVIRELLGINKIFDPVLLEEVIQYNDTDNFDRIVAAELAIAQAIKMDPIMGRVGGSGDARVKAMNRKVANPLFLPARIFKGKQRKLFT